MRAIAACTRKGHSKCTSSSLPHHTNAAPLLQRLVDAAVAQSFELYASWHDSLWAAALQNHCVNLRAQVGLVGPVATGAPRRARRLPANLLCNSDAAAKPRHGASEV